MDFQYLMVYLIVGLAAWQLIKRMLPRAKKKSADGGCSACSSGCSTTDKPAGDWATAPPLKR